MAGRAAEITRTAIDEWITAVFVGAFSVNEVRRVWANRRLVWEREDQRMIPGPDDVVYLDGQKMKYCVGVDMKKKTVICLALDRNGKPIRMNDGFVERTYRGLHIEIKRYQR